MEVKLESAIEFYARKALPHPTIPNTSDWILACNTLEFKVFEASKDFTKEEMKSLKKTIQYLKKYMTREMK